MLNYVSIETKMVSYNVVAMAYISEYANKKVCFFCCLQPQGLLKGFDDRRKQRKVEPRESCIHQKQYERHSVLSFTKEPSP